MVMTDEQNPEEPGEAEINELLYAVPVANSLQASKDDAQTLRFIQDVAYGIHPPAEIAKRWGLGDEKGLERYLKKNPKIVQAMATMRAAHKSDASVEERNRLKANYGVEMATPEVVNMAMDPTLSADRRLDAFKALQKQAGLESSGKDGKNIASGNQMTVNFLFSDRTETITTVVPMIEGEAS
jgi:hypothetical protein